MKLRPYQDEAKAATITGFETYDKQLVVIPTGGGKTILFAHLAQHYQPGRTLIIAHREELLTQAVDKIRKATGIWGQIEKGEHKASLQSPVVVASVQTLVRRLSKWPPDHFDLIVVDEAHHVLADSYMKVLAHFEGSAHILGVTATPDRGDKKNLGKYFDHLCYEVSLVRLIKDGFLSPIKVRTLPVHIDLSAVKKVAGDYNVNDLDEAIMPWLDRVAESIAQEAWDRKTIIFLPLVKTCDKMVECLRRHGLQSMSVSGYSHDRSEILQWFERADVGSVLCNSMLLTEGFDQPDVDCIVNLRPTQVRALFAQMVGRGTRLHPGKENLLLLDFLWQTKNMNLVTSSSLVAGTPDAQKAIDEMLKASSEGEDEQIEMDLLDAADEVEAQRMRKVIEKLKESVGKAAKTHDLVELATALGIELMDYEPMSLSDARGPTANQSAALERAGFSMEQITSFGHASMILDRLHVRRKEGLATPKQVRMMQKFRHPNPQTETFAGASKWLDDEFAKRKSRTNTHEEKDVIHGTNVVGLEAVGHPF